MIYPVLYFSSDRDHWMAKTIRFLSRPRLSFKSRAKMSHAFVRISRDKILDQVATCRIRPFSDYVRDDTRLAGFEFVGVDASRRNQAIELAIRERLGDVYAVGQMLGFIPVEFFRRLGVNMENPLRRGNVCSELIWEVIDHVGGVHKRELRKNFKDKHGFTPDEGVQWCADRADLFKLVHRA